MVRSGRGNTYLAVGMPADLESFEVGEVAETLKLSQRTHPVGTETIHICRAVGNLAIGIFHGPHAFVGTKSNWRTRSHFLHIADWVLAYRLLDEVNAVPVQQSQITDSLIHLPGAIGIQTNFGLGTNGFAHRANHVQFGADINSNL